jgi:phosphocarrier protein HPr
MCDSHHAVVTIKNRLGLHARPAMSLVDLANRYQAKVHIRRVDGEEMIDAKSIMQVMMLAATQGTQLRIEAQGADAQQAVEALADLVERQFDEADA